MNFGNVHTGENHQNGESKPCKHTYYKNKHLLKKFAHSYEQSEKMIIERIGMKNQMHNVNAGDGNASN